MSMKKFSFLFAALCSLFAATSLCGGVSAFADNSPVSAIDVKCKSAYLCDYNSGECVYKLNETKRLPIASVCKVMTLTLCFEAISCGMLTLTDEIPVSERAAGMGGSQVFLESGYKYPLNELIKSIVVCSANDSCVAVAEAVCGSEEEFVAKMNRRAEEFGCTDTLFANCTGLPKDTQYSCAKDVSVMFSHLITYDDYFNYSKIWLEDFSHPDNRVTSITNTNKLIKRYSYCDGGKTGYTGEAGFCLASTAKKDNLRLVSVVLGSDSGDDRFLSAVSMFNYGFSNYKNETVLDSEINLAQKVAVSGSEKKSVAVRPERNSYVFSEKGKSANVDYKICGVKLTAPVNVGDFAGDIEVYKDGVLIDKVALVSAEEAKRSTYGDDLKRVARNWAL